MKAGKVEAMLSGDGAWHDGARKWNALVRFGAMVGIELPDWSSDSGVRHDNREMDIPPDAVRQILAFDFAERATGDLRAMGDGMSKINFHVPSNINVWQHLKGETPLRNAANSLAEAARLLTDKITA